MVMDLVLRLVFALEPRTCFPLINKPETAFHEISATPLNNSYQRSPSLECKLGTLEFWLNSDRKLLEEAGHWWLIPVILATQEAEVRRIKASPGQIV
jgi:hypothetical protein